MESLESATDILSVIGWVLEGPWELLNKEVGQSGCPVETKGEQNGGGRGENNSNKGMEDKGDGGW